MLWSRSQPSCTSVRCQAVCGRAWASMNVAPRPSCSASIASSEAFSPVNSSEINGKKVPQKMIVASARPSRARPR